MTDNDIRLWMTHSCFHGSIFLYTIFMAEIKPAKVVYVNVKSDGVCHPVSKMADLKNDKQDLKLSTRIDSQKSITE